MQVFNYKYKIMETVLTILFLYIFAVSLYTIVVKNSPTNKHVPHFDYKGTIIDGMKGMAIGFAVVALLYYLLGFILTAIYVG
jgi:hypothetical protein